MSHSNGRTDDNWRMGFLNTSMDNPDQKVCIEQRWSEPSFCLGKTEVEDDRGFLKTRYHYIRQSNLEQLYDELFNTKAKFPHFQSRDRYFEADLDRGVVTIWVMRKKWDGFRNVIQREGRYILTKQAVEDALFGMSLLMQWLDRMLPASPESIPTSPTAIKSSDEGDETDAPSSEEAATV